MVVATRRNNESISQSHPVSTRRSVHSRRRDVQPAEDRLDRACDAAIELVKRRRALEASYDQERLQKLVRSACISLLRSNDPRERWQGMRFYLRALALQVKMEGQELDLMKKVIETVVLSRSKCVL